MGEGREEVVGEGREEEVGEGRGKGEGREQGKGRVGEIMHSYHLMGRFSFSKGV